MLNTKSRLRWPLAKRVFSNPHQQAGMATLTVSIVVLITITLMVVFAAKVGLFDLRMSANEYRHKEAFATADGGLEYAIQQFAENLSNSENGYIYDPNKDGTEDAIPNPFLNNKNLAGGTAGANETSVSATVGKATVAGTTVYTFTATGKSVDRIGSATVSEQVVFRHITGGKSPDTPIIADGAMDISGNMHVVPNPNASCPSGTSDSGCAVSVWTHGSVNTGSSISTCQYQGYSGGQCPNPSNDPYHTQLTNATYQGVDIVQSDPYTTDSPAGNFPPDLFEYVFGVPGTQWESIRAKADEGADATDNLIATGHRYDDCGDLNASSKGLIWITGNCTIGGGATIGSLTNPVILVVHNGDLTISGNSTLYGIVFAFDEPGGTDYPGPDVGSGAQIFGSLITNSPFAGGPGVGTFSVVWDPNVFTNIQNNSDESYREVSSVPGSWRDF